MIATAYLNDMAVLTMSMEFLACCDDWMADWLARNYRFTYYDGRFLYARRIDN